MDLKRILTLTVFLSLLASVISGCQAASPAAAAQPPLVVEYTQWYGDYSLLVAQELGLFDKYNVKVDARYYEVYSTSLGDLLAGTLDCLLAGASDVVSVATRGDFRAILVYDDGGASSIVAAPDILTAADLKGKKIGVNVGTPRELHVYALLAQAGLTVNDVTLVNMDPEAVPDAIPEVVQAGYVWEPHTSEALKRGNRLLYTTAGTSRQLKEDADVIICRADVVDQRPEQIYAFVQAWFEAVDYRLSHPAEANAMIAAALGIPVEEVSGDAILLTREDNQAAFLSPAPGQPSDILRVLQKNLDFLVSVGDVSIYPDLNKLLDTTFIE